MPPAVDPPKLVLSIESPPEPEPSKRSLAGRYAEAIDFAHANAPKSVCLLDFGDRPHLAASTAASLNKQVPNIEFTASRGKVYAQASGTAEG